MTLPSFGVTSGDLRIPSIDLSNIPATSETTLSTSDLDEYLDDARADIAVEFKRRSLEASDMTSAGDRLAIRYIKRYAVAEAIERLGSSDEVHQDALDKRDRAWSMFKAYLDEGSDQSSAVLEDTRLASKQPTTFAGEAGENMF
jgi:hypothetical protein